MTAGSRSGRNPDPALRLGLIVASTRAGRFGPTVAGWFAAQVERGGRFDPDIIDLARIELPPQPAADDERVAQLRDRLAAADAMVVVTPEYNHSFPGHLKHAVDLTYEQWFAKPVAFVAYGGLAGGLRAVEHLRAVFAELHATTIRETVSFHNVYGSFDADGQPLDVEGSGLAASKLLDQLSWWAGALRAARARAPYPA